MADESANEPSSTMVSAFGATLPRVALNWRSCTHIGDDHDRPLPSDRNSTATLDILEHIPYALKSALPFGFTLALLRVLLSLHHALA